MSMMRIRPRRSKNKELTKFMVAARPLYRAFKSRGNDPVMPSDLYRRIW